MAIWEFEPLAQERIWGGRNLEERFGRVLPEGKKIGETWELVDRAEAQSVVRGGGESLHSYWDSADRKKIFGAKAPDTARFPILIKLLDAQEKLSLQVHPPASMAKELGGDPKTEMWFFLETQPGADIYAGLKKGVGRKEFESGLVEGKVADCFHRLVTEAGQAMFLPSGRVHAIGAGNVILEIQQNSDTTYRVYDWNRKDASGKARALHVKEALASIQWEDHEPTFVQPRGERLLVCDYFKITRWWVAPGEVREVVPDAGSFRYLFVADGRIKEEASGEEWAKGAARFVTADHGSVLLHGVEDSTVVQVEFP
ncbi:MAG: mannose-6-phosphate isomerase [Verrucomicrobia bacterium]|nr:mannose-6-phosphate isomerase [Verrucomicrobiota bacterium]